jgi:hypothetical protein
MRLQAGPLLLGVVILGAAALALLRGSNAGTRLPGDAAVAGAGAPSSLAAETLEPPLPPNHPPIHPGGVGSSLPSTREEAAALVWVAPSAWQTVANRSAIRLATYRVPGPTSQGAGAELTVTRAGGTTDENLERWVGQFDKAGRDVRKERTVAGLRVTTLEVSGTYDGGMSRTGPETASPGWSLLGAVVETSGPFYFFKMVGPTDAVRAARPAFDALVLSVRKPS